MSEFVVALAALRADLPPIRKRTKGQHGKYADYPWIKAKVDPVLAKHGWIWWTSPQLMVIGDDVRFVLSYCLEQIGTGHQIAGAFPLGEMDPLRQGSQISYATR